MKNVGWGITPWGLNWGDEWEPLLVGAVSCSLAVSVTTMTADPTIACDLPLCVPATSISAITNDIPEEQ